MASVTVAVAHHPEPDPLFDDGPVAGDDYASEEMSPEEAMNRLIEAEKDHAKAVAAQDWEAAAHCAVTIDALADHLNGCDDGSGDGEPGSEE